MYSTPRWGRGGGTVGYPVPQNGMMTHGKLRMDMNKNRYEKPVQTPSRGVEVANPECVEVVQRSETTAARGSIQRNGTIHKTSWPKEVDSNRYEKPVQSPYWGAKMTNLTVLRGNRIVRRPRLGAKYHRTE